MKLKTLGETLLEQGVIDAQQLADALAEQRRRGSARLGRILVELGLASDAHVMRALATQSGLEPVDLGLLTPDPRALALVAPALARRHQVLPLELDAKDGTLTVALASPHNTAAIDAVELATKLFVQPVLAQEAALAHALERCFPEGAPVAAAPVRAARPKRVGELLLEAGIVSESQLAIALAEQRRVGGHLGQILVQLGLASDETISRALASQTGVEHLNLDAREPDPRVLVMVPEALARQHQLAPLAIDLDSGTLQVAMLNPSDIVAIDAIEMATNLFVQAGRASERQISRFLDRAYRRAGGASAEDSPLEVLIRRAIAEQGDEQAAGERGSVSSLVDELLADAIRREATDLHFEPAPNVVRVRYRIDGDLVQGHTLAQVLLAAVVARIKVMAELDIALTRVPQDGKIHFPFESRQVDLRVSTFPTLCGESVVLRILDQGKAQFTLESLGLDTREREILHGVAQRPNGLVLAVGPTGSGKTTTLYALLRAVDSSSRKLITLEDPVEYEMPLITQCQINEKAGLTFANGLRAILRHDPDTILVGEMRDGETARMALRAALTGHLVLSTLHANDALRTISRLRDMELEAYLIASCLIAVCAQRLVRLICAHCRTLAQPAPIELERVGLAVGAPGEFARGAGCARCGGSGAQGRRALFEVLLLTPELAQLIARDAPADELREGALRAGMVPFRANAQRLAAEGLITLEEAARVSAEG